MFPSPPAAEGPRAPAPRVSGATRRPLAPIGPGRPSARGAAGGLRDGVRPVVGCLLLVPLFSLPPSRACLDAADPLRLRQRGDGASWCAVARAKVSTARGHRLPRSRGRDSSGKRERAAVSHRRGCRSQGGIAEQRACVRRLSVILTRLCGGTLLIVRHPPGSATAPSARFQPRVPQGVDERVLFGRSDAAQPTARSRGLCVASPPA